MFTPTALDLMILALAAHEDVTAYDLKRNADVSVAASLPALRRLEKADLLTVTQGTRRSRRYRTSKAGRRMLQRFVGTVTRDAPVDLESVVRIAFLLTIANPRRLDSFLRRASDATASKATAVARSKRPTLIEFSRGDGHRWMKEIVAKHRMAADAAALDEIRGLLASKSGRNAHKARGTDRAS